MGYKRGWQDFEARVARLFGGRRRGAQTSRDGSGLSDVIDAPGFAIECTLLARPTFQQMLDKARQAERAATVSEMPIVICKRKHDRDGDALVVMRLEVWQEWHLHTSMVES